MNQVLFCFCFAGLECVCCIFLVNKDSEYRNISAKAKRGLL